MLYYIFYHYKGPLITANDEMIVSHLGFISSETSFKVEMNIKQKCSVNYSCS